MTDQTIVGDRFGLGRKWFWIGIAVAFTSVNVVAGLIYGIALAVEKDHRSEGAIIIVFTLVWFAVATLWLGPLLVDSGFLPDLQAVKAS